MPATRLIAPVLTFAAALVTAAEAQTNWPAFRGASPIAAGDRIYLASEEGDVFVLQAGREFKLLATNRMGEVTMAAPAAAGNTLIVRTQTQLVGIRAQG